MPSSRVPFKEKLLQAQQSLKAGQIRQALAQFRELREFRAQNPQVLLGLAQACLDDGRAEEARTLAGGVVASHPDLCKARLLLAQILGLLGQYDEARAEAMTVLEQEPGHKRAAKLLYDQAVALGDVKEAERVLEEARTTSTDNTWSLAALAKLASAKNEYGRAARCLGEIAERRPDDPDVRVHEAIALAKSGDVDAAKSRLEAMRAETTFDARTTIVSEQISKAIGKPFGSLEMYAATFEAEPAKRQNWRSYATQLAFRGDDEGLDRIQAMHLKAKYGASRKPIAEALAAIDAEGLTPNPMFDLAVRHLWNVRKDRSIDWETWRQRAYWGRAANYRIAEALWYDANNPPTLADDFQAVVHSVDFGPLDDAIAEGRGCLIAVSHLINTLPIVFAVDLRHRDVLVAGTALRRRAGPKGDPACNSVSLLHNPVAKLRQLVQHLKAGGVVLVAPDSLSGGGRSKDLLSVPFGTGDLKVRSFAPYLAHKTGARTVWGGLHWVDGKVSPRFSQLPHSVPGEDKAVFAKRWSTEFAARIEDIMKDQPEATSPQAPWHLVE